MQKTHNPEIIVEDGLIVVAKNDAPALFSSEAAIRQIVALIKKEVSGREVDLTTVKGREAIKSMAFKVSKSKVLLDNLGKDLVAGIKAQASVIDAARKIARDDLDSLRDEVRKPLTDWEQEQDRIALEEQRQREAAEAARKLAEEIERCHGEALLEDEVQTLRKEKQERERAEAQRLKKEQEEAARIEYEKRIEQQAKERAEREAKEAIQRQKAEADRKILEAQAEADRKIREAQEEINRKDRQRFAEEENRQRLEEAEKAKAEKAANLKKNRDLKKKQAVFDMMPIVAEFHSGNNSEGVKLATAIVEAIEIGKIANLTINF